MKNDIVARWLKNYVGPSRYREYFWGYYDFSNGKIKQNVGAVYGIWMKANQAELDEYKNMYKKSLNSFKGYIPLYWGKDVSPCARLGVHLEKINNTGSLDLINSIYAGRKIIFGCVLTKEYEAIEKKLYEDYPPKAGADYKIGRRPAKRKILE